MAVQDGTWIRGAPTHVLAELLSELERDGWTIERVEEIARMHDALRECTILSGADVSDGFPTWPDLPTFAVREVAQARTDYDDLLREGLGPPSV